MYPYLQYAYIHYEMNPFHNLYSNLLHTVLLDEYYIEITDYILSFYFHNVFCFPFFLFFFFFVTDNDPPPWHKHHQQEDGPLLKKVVTLSSDHNRYTLQLQRIKNGTETSTTSTKTTTFTIQSI